MAINCNECLRIISRQIDRATSDKETQEARTHAIKCEECRVKFNIIAGADRLLGKMLASQRLTDNFSGTVAEKLAEAHLAESIKGIPKAIIALAIMLGLIVVIFLIAIFSRSGPDVPIIGKVSRYEGEIELAWYKSESYSSADIGEDIYQGAKARTKVGGALLKLNGGEEIALSSETIIDLSKYHDGNKLILEKGEVYILVPDTSFQVDTPSAKVYGDKAIYFVRYESSGKTTVFVESGTVDFFNAASAIVVGTGEKSELLEDEKPKKPKKANIENYLSWVRQLGL